MEERSLPRSRAGQFRAPRQCQCFCHDRNTQGLVGSGMSCVLFLDSAVGFLLKARQEEESRARNMCAPALPSSRESNGRLPTSLAIWP